MESQQNQIRNLLAEVSQKDALIFECTEQSQLEIRSLTDQFNAQSLTVEKLEAELSASENANSSLEEKIKDQASRLEGLEGLLKR